MNNMSLWTDRHSDECFIFFYPTMNYCIKHVLPVYYIGVLKKRIFIENVLVFNDLHSGQN